MNSHQKRPLKRSSCIWNVRDSLEQMGSSSRLPSQATDAVDHKVGTPSQVLRRIQQALEAAAYAITPFLAGTQKVEYKSGRDPITEADRIVNRTLRDVLLRHGEGWLSEESVDDLSRLKKDRLWVVDPIDGTREFISGIPEWR